MLRNSRTLILRKAKQAITKPVPPYSFYELDALKGPTRNYVSNFVLRHLNIPNRKVQGLEALAWNIQDLSRGGKKCHIDDGRRSVTLMISNASGVGKTFASLAVETVLNAEFSADYYLPLYVGFGSEFPLTEGEKELLRGSCQQSEPVDNYTRVWLG